MDDARRTSSQYSPANLPSAYYAAGLIAVAAFLVLFLLFPEPIRQYTAQVELEQEASGQVQSTADASLISQATVDQLANELLANESPEVLFRSEVMPVNEWKARVRLEIASRYANESLSLSQAIAVKIIASQPTTITPREAEQRSMKEDVLRRLALTKESERAIDDELSKLEREHLAQSLAQMRELATAPKNEQDKVVLSDLALAWQAARGRLQDLETRRAELLVTRTEAHPLVQQVNFQIQQQLETMAGLPSEPVKQATFAANQATLPHIQRMLQAYQTRLTELTTNRDSIRTRRENLESELIRLSQPLQTITLRTAIVTPATIVERVGGRPSPVRLAAMVLAACFAGVVTFYIAQRITTVNAVQSVEQILQELGLPVVTVMKVRRPHFQAVSEHEWLRTAIFSAELIVVALAFAFAIAYSSVHDLSQPASEDPLGIVAETLDRVGETVRR